MTVEEKIQQIESEISKLKFEQSELSARYISLKDEFRALIDKMNAFTNQKKARDEYILQRLDVLGEELAKMKTATAQGVNIDELAGVVADEETAKVEQTETVSQTASDQDGAYQPNFTFANEEPAGETVSQTAGDQTETNQPDYTFHNGEPKQKEGGFDLEKFVGENLISKLGILILLVGVAIGGKYAFDHDLISPAMRIVLGVLVGASLLGVAYKLKPNYEKFSAVLCSGGWATLYFMTYFAYGFYGLINMPFAFVLMMLITVCTVFSAWWYNKQVIAVIGQVGAYVIPFMLSTGEGNVFVLLAYIAFINVGFLVVSIKKYWRKSFFLAYVSSWTIMLVSVAATSFSSANILLLLLFAFIYFAIFYATVLVNKYFNGQQYQKFDVFFLLSNAFLFFGIGFRLLAANDVFSAYQGVFTLGNALLHLAVFYVLTKRSLFDDAVRYLVFGLVVLFIALGILVWFSGHWITMFWMLEAAILFFVARKKQVAFYEYMSYPLFVVALLSLFADWGSPDAAYNSVFSVFYELFNSMRQLWDANAGFSQQGRIISYINTLAFFAVGVGVVYVDKRYPATYKNRYFDGSRLSGLLLAAVFLVITCAVYVHFTVVLRAVLWAVEAVAVLYFANKYSVERGGVASLVVAIFALASWLGYIGCYEYHYTELSTRLLVMNVIAVVLVACYWTWLFLYGKGTLNIAELGVDTLRVVMLWIPLIAVCIDICEADIYSDDKMACLCVIPLVYFTVLYFCAHRFYWSNYAVKLMAFLRVSVAEVLAFPLMALTYTASSFSHPCLLRYTIVLCAAFAIYLMLQYRSSGYRLFKELDAQKNIVLQDTFIVLAGLTLLSAELVNICYLLGYSDGYKLALSIFFGLCSLALVYFGLVKKMKHIRIEGIVLFAFALLKLFFHDISHFSTISKTIVFMSMGVLLLVVSFVYQKIAKEQAKLEAEEKNAAE